MRNRSGISIIGRKGSKAVTQIVTNCPLTRYTSKCSVVVNYGLAGKKLENFMRKHPSLKSKNIINKFIGKNKFDVLKDVAAKGIEVPDSVKILPKGAKMADFIVKKFHSQGGVGIEKAKTRSSLATKYYQKFISNRRYELRVHGFLWTPEDSWLVQKRLGDASAIAWNYHQGGRFQTIRNPEGYKIFREAKMITKRVLELRRMAFGAVDFIVTTDGQLLFIEINSAPGFTELSRPTYVNAFSELSGLSKSTLRKYYN